MGLLNHVSITLSDLERAAGFDDAVMAALGESRVMSAPDRVGYRRRSSAAFVRDPDGNRLEAVCHR